MTWREKWRRDPDLAESIIETLKQDLKDAEKQIEMLKFALERIADGGQCGSLMSQIERMEKIAKEALK
jgi:transposase